MTTEIPIPCIRDPKNRTCPPNCPSHIQIRKKINALAAKQKLTPQQYVESMKNMSKLEALFMTSLSRDEYPCKNFSGKTQIVDITNLFDQ